MCYVLKKDTKQTQMKNKHATTNPQELILWWKMLEYKWLFKGSEDRGHRLGTLGTLLAIPDRTNSCFVIVPAVQAQCQAANGFEGLIFIIYTLLTKHRSQGPDSRSQGVHREDFSS